MEHEERIRLLLSMQEHPELYSDEQLRQMIADDPELMELLEQLALTKRVFVKRETDNEAIPVEEEWQRFAADYADEIEGFGKDEARTAVVKPLMGIIPYKVAAGIIGILFTAGVAFATIHIVRNAAGGDWKVTTQEARISNPQALPADTAKADTVSAMQSVVFDNTPLEKMLPQIAAYYNKEVEFVNDDARQFRFYFVWKPEEGLEVTLHRMNLFESVIVELNNTKITVK
ncbi:MAG: DUF4974 domain-containing protein [Prevotella sp.]|nr:DUF4974 domain-containing protein [Prevotella sp.]